MTSITLEPFTHNSKSCIAIKFLYNFEVKEYKKKKLMAFIGQKHIVHFISI